MSAPGSGAGPEGVADRARVLECGVCLEPYSSRAAAKMPVLLPCAHTLCRTCVAALPIEDRRAAAAHLNASANGSGSGNGNGADMKSVASLASAAADAERYLTCPLCSSLLLVPVEGVSHYKPNFALMEVIEAFSAAGAAPALAAPAVLSGPASPTGTVAAVPETAAVQYSRCAECANAAPVVFCAACNADLCDACDRGVVHGPSASRLAQRHERVAIERKRAAEPRCPAHPTKELDVFCHTCQRVICPHCRDYGEHKGHGTALRAAVVDGARKALFASTVSARALAARLQSASAGIGELQLQLSASAVRAKKEIHTRVSQHMVELQLREEYALSRVGDVLAAKRAVLSRQRDDLALAVAQLTASCEEAKRISGADDLRVVATRAHIARAYEQGLACSLRPETDALALPVAFDDAALSNAIHTFVAVGPPPAPVLSLASPVAAAAAAGAAAPSAGAAAAAAAAASAGAGATSAAVGKVYVQWTVPRDASPIREYELLRTLIASAADDLAAPNAVVSSTAAAAAAAAVASASASGSSAAALSTVALAVASVADDVKAAPLLATPVAPTSPASKPMSATSALLAAASAAASTAASLLRPLSPLSGSAKEVKDSAAAPAVGAGTAPVAPVPLPVETTEYTGPATTAVVTGLVPGNAYALRVRARTDVGWGDFSRPLVVRAPTD